MAIQVIGNGGNVAEVDGTLYKAIRMTPRPLDHAGLGHYSYGGFTGILAAALGANSEIFQFRWTDATRFAVIRRIKLAACVSTTFFAAGVPVQLSLVKSTAWTVVGSGGTTITAAALLKRRTNMGSSLVNDIRIATTGALTAGTKTLETLAISSLMAGGPITLSLNGTIIPAGTLLFEAQVGNGDNPLILGTNEGFSITSVAVPATGTWTVSVDVEWAEVAAY